jgi:protein Mpv17
MRSSSLILPCAIALVAGLAQHALAFHHAAGFLAPARQRTSHPARVLGAHVQHVTTPRARLGRRTSVQDASMLGFVLNPSAYMALVALPTVALNTVLSSVRSSPMLADCLFAGVLYVFGKVTSSAILGNREDLPSLTKWFVCGLVDGYACHAWYSFLEFKFSFMADRLQQALIMNGLSAALFTPAYCAGFLALLSLLEGKGISGAKARLSRDFNSLSEKSIKVWGLANIPLFWLVPLHMRVVVSMGMHYVYLVGLALWDANARKAAQKTAWGSQQQSHTCNTQPGLNLALAKVPLAGALPKCDVPP